MTREEALLKLWLLAKDEDPEIGTDTERAHMKADDILVELLDDSEIALAYEAVGKWYA